MATRGLSLRGQFLAHVVQRAVSGTGALNEQVVTEMVPGELLKMAKTWRREPEAVIAWGEMKFGAPCADFRLSNKLFLG